MKSSLIFCSHIAAFLFTKPFDLPTILHPSHARLKAVTIAPSWYQFSASAIGLITHDFGLHVSRVVITTGSGLHSSIVLP